MIGKAGYTALIAAALLSVVCSAAVPGMATAGGALVDLLPAPSEIHGWRPDEEPRTYMGTDLFLLVNGGAELYFEYGFDRAVSVVYQNGARKWVALEIYRMKDNGGAFGLYSSKRGSSGDPLPIGDEGMIAGYYLNFWKGRFVVTLTGGDGSPGTAKALRSVARAVDGKIQERGEVPPILRLLPEGGADRTRIYIRGNLGFSKHTSLRTPCRFPIKEGALASYGGFTAHVLKYENADESKDGFSAILNCLKGNETSQILRLDDTRVMVQDGKEQGLRVEREGIYVILVSGGEHSRAKEALEEIKKRIQRGSS